MKRMINIFLSFAVISFFGCSFGGNHEHVHDGEHGHEHEGGHESALQPSSSTGNFGETITPDDAVPATQLAEILEGKEAVEVKISGEVASVCQMSGCWMDVDIGDGEIVHVTFKDDAFVLPKDAAGKQTVIEGMATYEEIPVKMLKHLAKDEGKSPEEIDAITEPKMEYTFIARGVILQDKPY